MSEKLESLLPCPCGSQAELHEWEEIDGKRWAARVKCTCGWEGPIGYADNRLGCFDAVNDLHKQRAIAAWNARFTRTEHLPSEDEPTASEKEESAYFKRWENEPKPAEAPIQHSDELVSRTPREKAAYLEGVKDGKMYAVRDSLTREDVGLKSLDNAAKKHDDILEKIDLKAEAGLCHGGTREFLKDIRAIIKEASNG